MDPICILPTINRAAAIVIPTRELLDWINTTPAKLDKDYTLENLQKENTSVFLIPEFESIEQVQNWFKKDCKDALTELLLGWCTDQQFWPKVDWQTFESFYEIRIEPMVFDMGDAELLHDDD